MLKRASAILLVCGTVAIAGVNQYVDKSYPTIVAPTSIGLTMTGATTTAVVVSAPSVSNAVTGVGMFYPGTAALILGVNCGDGGAGVITPYVLSCATTGGTYVAESQYTVVAYTNVNRFVTVPFVPNQTRGYLRVAFVSSGVTNGSVSAVLAAESK